MATSTGMGHLDDPVSVSWLPLATLPSAHLKAEDRRVSESGRELLNFIVCRVGRKAFPGFRELLINFRDRLGVLQPGVPQLRSLTLNQETKDEFFSSHYCTSEFGPGNPSERPHYQSLQPPFDVD